MTKGIAAFVSTHNQTLDSVIVAVMDPLNVLKIRKKKSQTAVFQYFGCEDSVLNHLQMLMDISQGKSAEVQRKGEAALSLRRFTVECLHASEYLTMHVSALDRMKKNFKGSSRSFFQKQISQTLQVITYQYFCTYKQGLTVTALDPLL